MDSPKRIEAFKGVARHHRASVEARRLLKRFDNSGVRKIQCQRGDLNVLIDGSYKILETRKASIDSTGHYSQGSHDVEITSLNKLAIFMQDNREKFGRIVPHFERLLLDSQILMPRYLYRATHNSSAGRIFQDNEGTHFISQFAKVNQQGHLSDLSIYDHETLVDYLKIHVNCWRSTGGISYDSHFVSTTDSFEHAVTWAKRFKKHARVTIYAIDLWRLSRPALIINMAHAMRAWNLKADMIDWRYKMYTYGAETEWIILDHLVAQEVTKISFDSFTQSTIRSENLSLFDVIPRLEHDGSRSILHRHLYFTKEEQKEMDRFDNKVWIKKFAPIPPMIPCIRSDRRIKFDHHAANRIYNLVKELKDPFKSEIFMYLVSTMSKTDYYCDSIVSEVSRFFPLVIRSNLHHVKALDTDSEEELLAYYRPERGIASRKDVDKHHKLVEDTIRAWVRYVQKAETTAWRDLPVYIIRGASSSLPNILSLEAVGKQGKCKINWSSVDLQAPRQPLSTFPFSYKEILERGTLIRRDLSDKEHAHRNTILYDDVFHVVKG